MTPKIQCLSLFAGTLTVGGEASITGPLTLTGVISVDGTQVVGNRDTGWTAMTGTPNEATAYATGSITLVQLAERVTDYAWTDRNMTTQMNGAEQAIRITIGDLVISNVSLKHQVDELTAQLAEAQAKIVELEAENAQANLSQPIQPVM